MISSFLGALGILAIVVPLVLTFVQKSIWVRLELITAILSLFMFIFLFLVLFYGVRFDKNERYRFNWFRKRPVELLDTVSTFDTGGLFTEGLSEGGLLGCLLGLLIDLVMSFLILFLIAIPLWLGFNILEAAIGAIAIPLFFLFRRSIRYIVVRGRSCRGNVTKSLYYGVAYTIMNSIWFYLILFGAHYITNMRR